MAYMTNVIYILIAPP